MEFEVVWLIRTQTKEIMHLLRKFLLYKMLVLFKYPYFVNCYSVLVKVHARNPVLRIRIHMFLGPQDPDPDPLVRCMDPDPSIIMQK